MELHTSPIPDGSIAVRWRPDPARPDYQQGIAVKDYGDWLYLSLFVGIPMAHGQWRTAAKRLFPNARQVRFERRNGRDRMGWVNL